MTDPRLPSRIRQGLNVESGLNDGICVPLLFIALAIADAEAARGDARAARSCSSSRRSATAWSSASICGRRGRAAAPPCRAHGLAESLVAARSCRSRRRPRLRARRAARRQRLHRGVRRRARVRGAAPRRRRRGRRTSLEELGELANAVTFLVFGAAIVGPALGDLELEGGALRRAQPHRRPHAARRARARSARARRPPTRRLHRLVRPTRARVDRLHRDRARGGRPAARVDDRGRRRLHDRPLGLRARAHGPAADRPLCEVVPAHPPDAPPPMEAVEAEPQRWRRPAISPTG